jgi:ankyrin repeat protein
MSPYKINVNELNLLEYACLHNNLNIVKYLIENLNMCPKYEDPINGNLLEYACYNNKLDIIKYLIEEYKMSPYDILQNGANLLEYAQWNNYRDIVDYLINDRKMKINEISIESKYMMILFLIFFWIYLFYFI